jgi:hypothetical protein
VPDDPVAAALAVLDRNRRGDWTCPAAGIYPHQWLWDSGFVAIGLARHDPARAAGELTALLRGQWSNGMVPHMVFADDVHDQGSRRLWGSRRDPRSPRGVATSCITQPPVLAIAARRVADHLPPDARAAFLADVVPKLLAHHAWLYRDRDPHGTGLVTLIHPWECGLDTSPPWMAALRRLRPSIGLRVALALRLTALVRAVRRDTRYLPARERASNDDGLRMLDLAYRARRRGWELPQLPADRSLQVQDVSFNALLAMANRDLTTLAADAGIAIDPALLDRFAATPDALETLWSDEHGTYCARDAVTGATLGPPTIAAFTMLVAGAHDERLGRLVAQLRTDAWWPPHPVPSIAVDTAEFDSERYWSGPTWVNTNWLVIEGLRRRGEPALADQLRRQTVELVAEHGCAEYFSALTGAPLGAAAFSWTAALVVDLTTPASAT